MYILPQKNTILLEMQEQFNNTFLRKMKNKVGSKT